MSFKEALNCARHVGDGVGDGGKVTIHAFLTTRALYMNKRLAASSPCKPSLTQLRWDGSYACMHACVRSEGAGAWHIEEVFTLAIACSVCSDGVVEDEALERIDGLRGLAT